MSGKTEVIYVRNYPCAVCGSGVGARKIMNGWLIVCKCGEDYRREFSPPNGKLWKRVSVDLG